MSEAGTGDVVSVADPGGEAVVSRQNLPRELGNYSEITSLSCPTERFCAALAGQTVLVGSAEPIPTEAAPGAPSAVAPGGAKVDVDDLCKATSRAMAGTAFVGATQLSKPNTGSNSGYLLCYYKSDHGTLAVTTGPLPIGVDDVRKLQKGKMPPGATATVISAPELGGSALLSSNAGEGSASVTWIQGRTAISVLVDVSQSSAAAARAEALEIAKGLTRK